MGVTRTAIPNDADSHTYGIGNFRILHLPAKQGKPLRMGLGGYHVELVRLTLGLIAYVRNGFFDIHDATSPSSA
jgi:hypothetical protein